MSKINKEVRGVINETAEAVKRHDARESRRFQEDSAKAWGYLNKRFALSPEWLDQNNLTLTSGVLTLRIDHTSIKDTFLICLDNDNHYHLIEESGNNNSPTVSTQIKFENISESEDRATTKLFYQVTLIGNDGKTDAILKIQYGYGFVPKLSNLGPDKIERYLKRASQNLGQGNILLANLHGFISPESLLSSDNLDLTALRLHRLIKEEAS